jgi:hypothetical protein
MPTRRAVLSYALTTVAAASAGCVLPGALAASRNTLKPFESEAEFLRVFKRWSESSAQRQRRSMADAAGSVAMNMAPVPMAAPVAEQAKKEAASSDKESITNNQTAGVDEGGIVKRAGDHLVILRRGRLFTVRVGGDALEPVHMIDAFAPGSSPQGAWYDEMLIAGSTVVVVGYSYQRGGTEIGLFDLSRDGRLSYRSTHHLRSFDYYSSRNYASRLIGDKLVFYTPSYLQPRGDMPLDQLPAFRRWRPDATPSDFQRILPATRIYRTDDDFDGNEPLALHTITSIDLSSPSLRCESTAVMGPAGRVFYVSQGSVYVWTNSWRHRGTSAVFRIPLDGSAPTGLKATGVPIDQMSFLEEGEHLNVLLASGGMGEGMWGSELARTGMALLRLPLSAFGDGRESARREHYRSLPAMPGSSVQNRFIGDWLVWGGLNTGAAPGVLRIGAWAVRHADRSMEPVPLSPGHHVERIEALGNDALLVGGSNGDLHFSSVRLAWRGAEVMGKHIVPGAMQGETRSHGFFYKPVSRNEGLLGLPVMGQGVRRRHKGVYSDGQGAASVIFLRQRDLAFTALGQLESRNQGQRDDGCVASCVDWYGNARPIFSGDRVFALMGYELVEGRLSGGTWRGEERIEERRRVDFSPAGRPVNGRYSPFN